MQDTNFESHVVRGPHGAHEGTDINTLSVSKFGLVIAAVTLVSMMAMWFFLDVLARFETRTSPKARPMAAQNPVKEPPLPRLQGKPRLDLAAYQAEEARKLAEYKWVDGEKKIVQIPVERALDLVAKDGKLPVWTPAVAAKAAGGVKK
ncbi:MAG: hypothetical protein ACKV22_36925 [Bryobacteraceae bacterium]